MVDQQNKMFLWLCYCEDKLKIILFHDFNAVASSNMNQSTSSESSEIFTDQSNMYPLNDSPTLDFTAPWDIMVSTPDFTLKMITLSFHHQPCHLIIATIYYFHIGKFSCSLNSGFCSLYKYFIDINRTFKCYRFLVGCKKHFNSFVDVVSVSHELIIRNACSGGFLSFACYNALIVGEFFLWRSTIRRLFYCKIP